MGDLRGNNIVVEVVVAAAEKEDFSVSASVSVFFRMKILGGELMMG